MVSYTALLYTCVPPSKKPLRFPISQRQIGKMNQERPNGSFLIRNVSLWFFVFIDLNFIGSPSGAGFSRREWGGTFISRVWIFLFCSWERASLGSMDSQDDSISTSARASLLTNVSGSDISWVYNITNTWFHIQHCYIRVCPPPKNHYGSQ